MIWLGNNKNIMFCYKLSLPSFSLRQIITWCANLSEPFYFDIVLLTFYIILKHIIILLATFYFILDHII